MARSSCASLTFKHTEALFKEEAAKVQTGEFDAGEVLGAWEKVRTHLNDEIKKLAKECVLKLVENLQKVVVDDGGKETAALLDCCKSMVEASA